MYNIKSFSPTRTFLLTTLIISGCNDGSQTDSGTNYTSTTESKITAENAKPLAAAAFASVDAVQGLPIQSGKLSGRSANATSGEFNYSQFTIKQLSIIQQQSQLMGRSIPNGSAVTARKAIDCNLHITGDIADSSSLSAGDTVSFAFNACTYDSNLLVNGTIGITLTQISEDFTGTPPYELGLDTVLTDFMVDDEGSVFTSNGDISMLVSENAAGDRTVQAEGASLIVTKDSSSDINSLKLTNYLIDMNENIAGDYSVSLQGTVEIAIPFVRIAASFTTITPFSGNPSSGSENPTAGELHLTDASSQAWVIAQPDGVNIQIDIDLDGDDVVDDTVMSSWDELQDIF